jgi:hypothetical protein
LTRVDLGPNNAAGHQWATPSDCEEATIGVVFETICETAMVATTIPMTRQNPFELCCTPLLQIINSNIMPIIWLHDFIAFIKLLGGTEFESEKPVHEAQWSHTQHLLLTIGNIQKTT